MGFYVCGGGLRDVLGLPTGSSSDSIGCITFEIAEP